MSLIKIGKSLMLCAAVMSSITSNVATAAVLVSVIVSFLNVYEAPEVRKQSGKAFMIGLPTASMTGGMMTPAGSPLNMLGIDFLAEAGIRVSFVEWMMIGISIAMISLLFAWFIIAKVFKPAEIEKEKIREYIRNLKIPSTFDFHEKYVCLVVGCFFVLWILFFWFLVLNVTVVGTIGFAFLFFPKVGVLEWKEYTKTVSWASFFDRNNDVPGKCSFSKRRQPMVGFHSVQK